MAPVIRRFPDEGRLTLFPDVPGKVRMPPEIARRHGATPGGWRGSRAFVRSVGGTGRRI